MIPLHGSALIRLEDRIKKWQKKGPVRFFLRLLPEKAPAAEEEFDANELSKGRGCPAFQFRHCLAIPGNGVF
jgi:hypothetical protein